MGICPTTDSFQFRDISPASWLPKGHTLDLSPRGNETDGCQENLATQDHGVPQYEEKLQEQILWQQQYEVKVPFAQVLVGSHYTKRGFESDDVYWNQTGSVNATLL